MRGTYVHFLGLNMNPKQAMWLEHTKTEHLKLWEDWGRKYPQLRKWPPIFWFKEEERFLWVEVPDTDITEYVDLLRVEVGERPYI